MVNIVEWVAEQRDCKQGDELGVWHSNKKIWCVFELVGMGGSKDACPVYGDKYTFPQMTICITLK